jgi:hypothetical protein
MRRIAVAVFLGGGMGLAQSTLPAINPTTALPSSAATATGGPPTVAQAALPATVETSQPARVTYSPGLLEVDADNSSLNEILREISRQTGMKVTGGVVDERVFGKYGPAGPAEVLASLLDGTNINMILRETASTGPKELILTPREGGVTPPDLNGARTKEGAMAAAQQRLNGADPSAQAGAPRPPYGGTEFGAGGPDPSATGPHPTIPNYQPRSGPVFSPNGATPQQVYQQLQQMRPTPPQP